MESPEAWDAAWLAGEPVTLPEPTKLAPVAHPQIHALQHAAEQLRAARHWSHVDPDVAAAHREAVAALAAELAYHTENETTPPMHPEEAADAGGTTTTVVGNLTADIRLERSPAGTPVANFTIASTPRAYDHQAGEWKDGETSFIHCTLWREAAQNAQHLPKGTRVIATGTLTTRTYQAKDGQQRTRVELDVEELGASTRFATVRAIRRHSRRDPARARRHRLAAPGIQAPDGAAGRR